MAHIGLHGDLLFTARACQQLCAGVPNSLTDQRHIQKMIVQLLSNSSSLLLIANACTGIAHVEVTHEAAAEETADGNERVAFLARCCCFCHRVFVSMQIQHVLVAENLDRPVVCGKM